MKSISTNNKYALRDSKIGESFELVAIACDNAPLQVLSKVAYRPLSVRDAIACYVGEDFYHLKNECWPDRKVCLFILGDEINGADSTIFSRTCATCGNLILQDDTLRAAQSFFQSERRTTLRLLCLELVAVAELLLYQPNIDEKRLVARQRELLARLVVLGIQPNMHVGKHATLTKTDYYPEYLAGQLLATVDDTGAWQGVLTGTEVGFACQPGEKELFKKRLIGQEVQG